MSMSFIQLKYIRKVNIWYSFDVVYIDWLYDHLIRNKYVFEIRETLIVLFTFIAILIKLMFQFKKSNGISFYCFGFRKSLKGKTEKNLWPFKSSRIRVVGTQSVECRALMYIELKSLISYPKFHSYTPPLHLSCQITSKEAYPKVHVRLSKSTC